MTKAIAIQLLETMRYLDDIGIIHRDIKPENIIVMKDGGSDWLGLLAACIMTHTRTYNLRFHCIIACCSSRCRGDPCIPAVHMGFHSISSVRQSEMY